YFSLSPHLKCPSGLRQIKTRKRAALRPIKLGKQAALRPIKITKRAAFAPNQRAQTSVAPAQSEAPISDLRPVKKPEQCESNRDKRLVPNHKRKHAACSPYRSASKRLASNQK
ncbi:unnamed protein product, partial [Laminaria digitata]